MNYRETVIHKLNDTLLPLPYVYAFWLEGADANNMLDAYSDIDLWVDFEDEYEDQVIALCENALLEIAPFDSREVIAHGHPKIRQRIYHLAGSSAFFMIDFCWQLHSRDREEIILLKNSTIEAAKVIFDKADVIRYKPLELTEYREEHRQILKNCRFLYSQHCRVIKYVRRRNYLEAYAYYNKYVLNPLIDLLRLIHTPANTDYYLIHISHHIPEHKRKKLEDFARISSLEDIERNTKRAPKWFQELIAEYETI